MNETDIFICDAVRTPIGRHAGMLSGIRPDDLAAHVLRALRERNPQVTWSETDDVILGCTNQAGEDSRNIARMATLLAGFDPCVPAITVNRLCGSGMDAVVQAARAIRAGEAALTVAGGVESMSRAPYAVAKPDRAFDRTPEIHDTTIGWRFVNPRMKSTYGTDSMVETAEALARERGISRQAQDRYACESQRRAARAQERGRFEREIVPVEVHRKGRASKAVDDEHPRPTEIESLASLPSLLGEETTITAGNAAGINDGAAAMIVAGSEGVKRHGLRPRARILGGASAGVEPRVMGIGPVQATGRLLHRLGMQLADFDVIEINEAFAAQVLAVTREWRCEDGAAHINPNGGAIALGHPLGMSGTRLVQTAVEELITTDKERALCTMCVGVGQGIALAIERV